MAKSVCKFWGNGEAECPPFTTKTGEISVSLGPGVQYVYLKAGGSVAYSKLKGGYHTIAPGTYTHHLNGVVVAGNMIWSEIEY